MTPPNAYRHARKAGHTTRLPAAGDTARIGAAAGAIRIRATRHTRRRGPGRGATARIAALGCLLLALAALATLPAGCAPPRGPGGWAKVREITPEFLTEVHAQDPAIAADGHGRVALTWVTRDSAGRHLWLAVSRDSGVTFSDSVRVDRGDGRLVSFAEGRPTPVFGPGGALAIAWSERRADGTGAADLLVRASGDGGVTLGPPVTVNDDAAGPPPGLRWGAQRRWLRAHNPAAFHGFPALTFLPDGSLFAAWLDERRILHRGFEPPVSSIYTCTSLDGGQTWSANAALTDSACPCCRPVAATDPNGRVALAYRSGAGHLRDPALAISLDGGRTFVRDTVISRDRWYVEACPDQGPGLDWNRTGGGHYAWFTGVKPAGVYVLPWRAEGGAGGMRRALADSVAGAGHPQLASLGTATLIGVEARPGDDTTRSVLAVRALDPDGTLTPWIFLGADARSGCLAGAGGRVAFACWIESSGDRGHVRVARLTRRAAR